MSSSSSQKNSNKQFSSFFFVNLFLSLVFSLLFLFLFIRLKTSENSYGDYFSKIFTNFQSSFEKHAYNDYIREWFDPTLKSDEREQFQKYKLSVLARTINNYFKNILVDTQENIVTENLEKLMAKKEKVNYEKLKGNIKKHLKNNPDLQEVSTFDLDGNKIFGIKYKDSPNYVFSKDIVNDLMESKNLLLKKKDNQNVILLSVIENKKKKPFLIISQSIHQDFFSRILRHLHINDEIFYIKDSKNFVLFDNHAVVDSQINKSTPQYKIYNSLTVSEESNLSINLNNISYSLGTIVKKNNTWGNMAAIFFMLLFFLISFIGIDFTSQLARKYFFAKKEDSLETLDSPTSPVYERREEVRDLFDGKKYNDVEPITLEQYIILNKEKKQQDSNNNYINNHID